MTDRPAAFDATFSDFKLVRSRKVVQLVFEIPLEKSKRALEVLGGMPNPAAEVWCAIARMETTEKLTSRERTDGDRKCVKRAGILSNDERFWIFLTQEMNVPWLSGQSAVDRAANFIRKHCGVESRADLTEHNERWRDLDAQFKAWEREMEMTA